MSTAHGRDRRESERFPLEMHVRSYDASHFTPCAGDISLGGARVTLPCVPRDTQVEVLVQLEGVDVRVQGEIIEILPGTQGPEARVKFGELLWEDERAIARFLDRMARQWERWVPEAA